ncbi:FAD-binding oxidoreductase [Streptomyces sp. RerS4]|uniref:FAD-binding oxidoreductase n=1 Tax=Streptomyces sp. RerS4 TaxID=2942449 RepID=UPI00201CA71C|nr:FAD-binding oxidoreductase [Streptomyces sp. RerS4]UQW99951.1 FAD-binding oxidoreductase [Streptomyces sp. RerS4]
MISRRTVLRAGAATGVTALAASGVALVPAAFAGGPAPFDTLRARLTGDLILPADPGYDHAKQLQMARYDVIRPQAVAYCANSADVVHCVRFAQDHGLPTAVRSGGHSQAGYSTTTGLVIDVSRLNSIRPGRGTVRLGPGSQGVDILNTLAPLGLQLGSGTCPTVAVGGWVQGGGLGLTARAFGMGSDRLVSARVVLADGSIVDASADSHPDLYWALRGGGGGNFGVVTDIELRPVSVPSMSVYTLTFDGAHAVDVILAWQDWITEGPRELASELLVLLPEDSPEGTAPTVVVSGAYLGARAIADRHLDRLVRAAGRPSASREVAELPYQQAMMKVYGCGDAAVEECHRIGYSPRARLPRENYATYRNVYFNQRWSRATAEAALAVLHTDPQPGQFRFLGLFSYGGRINEVAPGATAFVHRDVLFEAGFQVGLAVPEPAREQRERAQAWVDGGYASLYPRSSRRSYQNYMDPALTNWREAYYGRNYARLQSVKRTYDPHRFFRFAQAID